MKLDRVGVVMLSTAGGATWTLPVLNAIKRASPATRITWVLQPGAATLVQGHPAVDDVLLLDRSRGWRAWTDLRAAGARFDVLLVLQSYFKAGLAAAMLPADVKLGFDRARARDGSWLFTNQKLRPAPVRHMQDQYLEFLEPLGVPAEPLEYQLGPWFEERPWRQEFFAQFDRPAVSFVIGTTKPEKDWPAERWARLADALRSDFGLEPVLVGGRSERELATERAIATRTSTPPRSALGSGLRRLVSILDGSALVISPDTGPLHMSVALSKPVVSLFGFTNPKRTGPYRRFHDLMVDAYGDPGEAYAADAGTRPGRMDRISVDDVLARVQRWRDVYAGSSPPKV